MAASIWPGLSVSLGPGACVTEGAARVTNPPFFLPSCKCCRMRQKKKKCVACEWRHRGEWNATHSLLKSGIKVENFLLACLLFFFKHCPLPPPFKNFNGITIQFICFFKLVKTNPLSHKELLRDYLSLSLYICFVTKEIYTKRSRVISNGHSHLIE